MKKLEKIRLHNLEKEMLAYQGLRCLKGGNSCTCGCHYANSGGSSTGSNDQANYIDDKNSFGGGADSCACASSSEHVAISEFYIG